MKNTQIKIVLIFFIIGITIISSMGLYFVYMLTNEDIAQNSDKYINNIKISIMIGCTLFAVISIIIGVFLSRFVITPISKLIKSAEKIAAGENIDKVMDTNKAPNKPDELANAFSIMTSELKENLNEVTRQKKQMETILLHMTDGIIAFNMEGKIILINPAAIKMLELLESDNSFEKIFGKLNVDINMEKIIYLENWTSQEQRIQVKEKYVNMLFAPFRDENDRPAGMIVVLQDITEHVKLDNMRKEFIADVSHELKTPITSIMGYADTLLESEYEKELQERFLTVISTEARRMARIVTDLLTLSKHDTKQIKWEKTEFDLGELVKGVHDKLMIEIEKKNHKVESFVTANVPPVYADRDGIERVVLNIITNSIKYTEPGGTIKIYVGFVYNDAYIKVIDNGIGIPKDDLGRIFERFYRVDKARTREMGGTGLGLSIAKEILDQNGGTIDIKSEKGKGTEVVIKIPTRN